MNQENYVFTSESVTEGHPDKLADQISDAILDAIIAQDPLARVAAETMVTTRTCFCLWRDYDKMLCRYPQNNPGKGEGNWLYQGQVWF